MVYRFIERGRYLSLLIALLGLLNLPARSQPREAKQECRGDCCFPAVAEVGGDVLSRRGVATFRYWGLKIYSAALYAPNGASSSLQSRETIEGEVKKKLTLCYHRSISIEQFVENTEEMLKSNPAFVGKGLEQQQKQIAEAYIPAEEGDTYSIAYDPQTGSMQLSFNDKGIVTIESPAFARVYFGIWLSKYSVGERFTAELFGER